jgi:hypothetical protein
LWQDAADCKETGLHRVYSTAHPCFCRHLNSIDDKKRIRSKISLNFPRQIIPDFIGP